MHTTCYDGYVLVVPLILTAMEGQTAKLISLQKLISDWEMDQ